MRSHVLAEATRPRITQPAPTAGVANIPLTTVSLSGNFDAYINISFSNAADANLVQLVVDSGNSMLIVPRWEDIAATPNWQANYTILGTGREPWGCPANVVKGPVYLSTGVSGQPVAIDSCVFYACTANPPDGGERTANFGAGCIVPWSSSGWNTPIPGVTMQAPLSYSSYPVVEFLYGAANQILGTNARVAGVAPAAVVSSTSFLRLSHQIPAGYTTFAVIKNLEWMSLKPLSLTIGSAPTAWPGALDSPVAFIDTGGGPAFLSDPDDVICNQTWPQQVPNPGWTGNSTTCQSIDDNVTIGLSGGSQTYAYTIDESALPPPAQGLTLVMCVKNEFMRSQNGMNIGGLSALFNQIAVDYANGLVGLCPAGAAAVS